LLLIKILLKPRKYLPDLVRQSQVGNGIGNGILLLEPQQRREPLLVKVLDTNRWLHIDRGQTDG
jgi:hypothetical protein